METITTDDIEIILRVVYLRNKCELEKIKRDALALRRIKDDQRASDIKKSSEFFARQKVCTENKKILWENRELLIQLRQKDISIRKLLDLFLKDWKQAEWNYLRELLN